MISLAVFFFVTSLTQICYYRKKSKENEISLQMKSLDDTKKILHEKEQALSKQQAILDQRGDNILERLACITETEQRLKEDRLKLEGERKVLLEEKNKLDLKMQAISSREEVCTVSLHYTICSRISLLESVL